MSHGRFFYPVFIIRGSSLLAASSVSADEGGTVSATKLIIAHHDSVADDTKQPFVIQFPDNYSPEKSYPLLVYLAQQLPKLDSTGPFRKPYFKIHVGVHGILAFPGLADADIAAAIATMKRDYAIDDNRIFLSGYSAGGSAVMTIAARHPDQFAGVIPLAAFGNNAFLDSLYNLPVFCHHGQHD